MVLAVDGGFYEFYLWVFIGGEGRAGVNDGHFVECEVLLDHGERASSDQAVPDDAKLADLAVLSMFLHIFFNFL